MQPSPLRGPTSDGFLSPRQRATLTAVCATIVPALDPPPGTPAGSAAAAYWRYSPAAEVAALFEQTLATEISPALQAQLRQALDSLENPALCVLTTGSALPFGRRTREAREALLQAWSTHPLPLLRQAFQTFKRLPAALAYSAPAAGGPNPIHAALSYPDPWRPAPAPASPANAAHPLAPLSLTVDTELEADACVIGSGAGGSVVAALLAQAGARVVVLEAGSGRTESTFDGDEFGGFHDLYARGGLLTTEDGGIFILAGRTLGGGTTVNWMTCFRPPERVLAQWAAASGVAALRGPELQASLAAVEARLHVSTAESTLNPNNAALMRGAAALGWHCAIQARNAHGCADCGLCSFGCAAGGKQSTLRTYLQDAYDAGARIVPRATAERVLLDGARVTGVEARLGPPGALPWRAERAGAATLTIRAPLVVVAAGAIESPALLLRSGVRLPVLGRHLYLHPSTAVIGRFAGDIAAWSGPLQAAHSDQFADLDGDGYGFKFETTPIYPGLGAGALPWENGAAFKRRMLDLKRSVSLLVLTRERTGGRVTLDRWGNPRIAYTPARTTTAHLLRGCVEGARLLLAAGAEAAFTLHTRLTQVSKDEAGGPGWDRFAAAVTRHGAAANTLMLFSAHQMGTCRMGADPATGVVDGRGAVHGYRGLYVADGSVFPLASGVNPMISIMGLAHWIGTRLAAEGGT